MDFIKIIEEKADLLWTTFLLEQRLKTLFEMSEYCQEVLSELTSLHLVEIHSLENYKHECHLKFYEKGEFPEDDYWENINTLDGEKWQIGNYTKLEDAWGIGIEGAQAFFRLFDAFKNYVIEKENQI